MKRSQWVLFALIVSLIGLALAWYFFDQEKNPPPAPREFRAVWVATVANIDWPSKSGLPVEQQRAEALAILERAQALKLNAIILQVRPAADALYASELEPWSEYLTGAQGRAPTPFYDPLEFWVTEAHRRGLELHAWFNPYRARHNTAKSPLAVTHIAQSNPEAVKAYGDLLWMDPAEPFAVHRTLEVISDVVRRYDIDGVHIDDYFYPYPIAAPATASAGSPVIKSATASELDFPDEPAWQRYRATGGKTQRAEWRRQQVNQLVEKIYSTIHTIKPCVRFGVSPFGIGRPQLRPRGIVGFSQYDKLYADVELWLEKGWLDYLAPQLYWPKEKKAQDFGVLLNYWTERNPAQRHIWPGLFTSSINDTPKSWSPDEITRQIDLTRAQRGATGHIHFSMIALLQGRRGIDARLSTGPYAQDALVPATPWLDPIQPPAVTLKHAPTTQTATIIAGKGKPVVAFAVWRLYGEHWKFSVQRASDTRLSLGADLKLGKLKCVVVTAVDAVGNESPRVRLDLATDSSS